MLNGFNLSAELAFKANTQSLSGVVTTVNNTLASINGKVKLDVDPKSLAQIQKLSGNMDTLKENMRLMNQAAAQATRAVDRVGTAFDNVAAKASGAASAVRSAGGAVRRSGQDAVEATNSFAEFGRLVGLSAKRFLAFSVAAGAMFTVVRAFKEGLTEAVAFDLQLNKLKQVSGDTAGEIREVGNEVMRLATNLGASSKDLMESAIILKQAGIATKDVKTALEGVAQAALAPNFSSMKQITEGAVAGYQQFGKEIKNVKEQLGAMNAVAGDFAVEASDLVSAVQKAGGAASQTGGSFNELLAIFTSVRSTTRESADSIATGLRTIFTRIQRNETVESLKALGINLRYTREEAEALGQTNMTDQFVGMYEATRRLSEGLGKLRTTDPRFSTALEELGGYRQVSKVIPLIQQFGEAQKALNVARLGGASLEAAAATRQDAIATKMAKVREEFQKFSNELVQSKGFKDLVKFATDFASGLIQIASALKPLLPMLATMATFQVFSYAGSFARGLATPSQYGKGVQHAAPKKFSVGGPVLGFGSGDTVNAHLEPGEFVVKKDSAQKIGYATLQNWNANARVKKYATGGIVTTENITNLLAEFQAKTGIDFSKLATVKMRNAEQLSKVNSGITKTARGAFVKGESPSVYLNSDSIKTMEQLRDTLAHEFGHAADAKLGGGAFASASGATAAGSVGRREVSLGQGQRKKQGVQWSEKYTKYYDKPEEGFARAFAKHVSGVGDLDDGERVAGQRSAALAPIIEKVAASTGNPLKNTNKARAYLSLPPLTDPKLAKAQREAAERNADPDYQAQLKAEAERAAIASGATSGFYSGTATARAERDGSSGRGDKSTTGSKTGPTGKSLIKEIPAVDGFTTMMNELFGELQKKISGVLGKSNLKGLDHGDALGEATVRMKQAYDNPESAMLKYLSNSKKLGTGKEKEAAIDKIMSETDFSDPETLKKFVLAEGGRGANQFVKAQERGGSKSGFVATGEGFDHADREENTVTSHKSVQGRIAKGSGATRLSEEDHLASIKEFGLSGERAEEALAYLQGGPNRTLDNMPSTSSASAAAAQAAAAQKAAEKARLAAELDAEYGGTSSAPAATTTSTSGTSKLQEMRARLNARKGVVDGQSPAPPIGTPPSAPTLGPDNDGRKPWLEVYKEGYKKALSEGRHGESAMATGVLRLSEQGYDAEAQQTFERLQFRGIDRERVRQQISANQDQVAARTDPAVAAAARKYNITSPVKGLAGKGPGEMTPDEFLAQNAETPEQAYQRKALADARQKFGSEYGIPEDETRARKKAAQQKENKKQLEIQEKRKTRAANRVADPDFQLLYRKHIREDGWGQYALSDATRDEFGITGRTPPPMPPNGPNGPNFGGRAGRVGAGLKSMFGKIGGGQTAQYGAMVAASMVGDSLDPTEQQYANAGQSQTAAQKVRGQAGMGGALSGAAMGAGMGMVAGPMGAAVGAVVGGLVGASDAMDEANKKIRDAKVGDALSKLSESFQNAMSSINGSMSGIDAATMSKQLSAARKEIGMKVDEETKRSWYNPRGWGGNKIDSTPEEMAAIRTKETREKLGKQASEAVGVLGRRANELAKENPDVTAKEAAQNLKSNPVSRQLMQLVAEVRGIPVSQVLQEFTETIKIAQDQIKTTKEIDKGRAAAETSAIALSRLADAATNAAASTNKLENSMSIMTGVFSGSVMNTRVASISGGFNFGTGTGEEFDRSVGAVNSAYGTTSSGFAKSASAADSLARVLPSVLATIGETPLSEGETPGSKAQKMLQDALVSGNPLEQKAKLDANPELRKAIDSAAGNLTKMDADAKADGGIGKKLKEDAGKVAEEITRQFNDAFKDAGEKITRSIEENANKFAEGLSQARQQTNTINEGVGQFYDIRLGRQKVEADVALDRTGVSGVNALSLQQLNAPLQARQEQLTGMGGNDANDPRAIAAKLADTRSKIAGAVAARDAAVGDRNAFPKAAKELDRLTGQAANLQNALKNLADASTRAAGIQEKLNAANQNKDSRLGYAGKFLTADPEQQMRMKRGQQMVAAVDSGKANLQDMTLDERKLFMEATSDLGETKLPSGITAATLQQRAVGAVPGVLDPKQEAERKGLQGQLVEVFKTAEIAQNALVEHQKSVNTDFMASLQQLHEKFFNRLDANLASNELLRLQNAKTAVGVTKNELGRESKYAEVFNRIGVTKQESLAATKTNENSFKEYKENDEKLKELKTKPLMTGGAMNDIWANTDVLWKQLKEGNTSGLRTVLENRGLENLSGEEQEEVLKRTSAKVAKSHVRTAPEDRKAAMAEFVTGSLENGRFYTQKGIEKKRDEAEGKLKKNGFDTTELKTFNEGDWKNLFDGMKNEALNLETLNTRIKDADKALLDFTTRIGLAEAAVAAAKTKEAAPPGAGLVPVTRAAGGSIFKPHGTDTVPAMLTPGEFVVNRASAQANMDLLQRLNGAKGPVMLAGGGFVPGNEPINWDEKIKQAKLAKARAELAKKQRKEELEAPAISSPGGMTDLALLRKSEEDRAAKRHDARWRWSNYAKDNPRGVRKPLTDEERGALTKQARKGDFGAWKKLHDENTLLRADQADQDRVVNKVLGSHLASQNANMGYQQNIMRGALGLPGEEGQLQAAAGALAEKRGEEEKDFQQRHGRLTYLAQARMGAGNFESKMRLDKDAKRRRVFGFANGGHVPGEGVGDSVHAMLTPGEYVFSRPAVQAIGADSLDRVHRFARGGVVGGTNYLADGGVAGGPGASGMMGLDSSAIAAMENFQSHSKKLGDALTGFGPSATTLSQALGSFNAGVDKLAGVIEKMPTEIKHQFNGELNVNVNGAEAMNSLKGELQQSIMANVMKEVVGYVGEKFPSADPGPIRSDPSRVV